MKELKTPVYIYDEPAEYSTFSGGINTDRNDLGLLSNQMKLCENMHLVNGNLHIRKGGKEFLELNANIALSNIQGIFIFTASAPYIIVANNGKFYYGLYVPFSKIKLEHLPIVVNESALSYDTSKLSFGLQVYTTDDSPSQNHDGFIYISDGGKYLIFQNKSKIEAIQYNSKLFITTGTRFVQIAEDYTGQLTCSIVRPYLPNGIEYTNIGPNLLSYLPSLHIDTVSTSPKTAIHAIIPIKLESGSVKIKTVMSYANGESPKDYRFKWERTADGVTFESCVFPVNANTEYTSAFKDARSIGHNEFTIEATEASKYRYRCSFARSFKTTYDGTTGVTALLLENEDYVIDKVDGYWFGQAVSVSYSDTLYSEGNPYYQQIQTCKKIFGYGNKFILYDDAFGSGNFWKTVIDNPSYITYRGGLNFKTDKDEHLIKVINFKGVIVCFAHNKILGGNISIVTGNGDDYNDSSSNYSPFSMRIVNKEITSDNADSIQVADNILIFKYKQSIYTLEASQLNYEIVSVSEINTHLKQANAFIQIPFYDNRCISEKNEDFYALYWKDSYDDQHNLIHAACRLKIYYKDAYSENGHIFYPSIIDTSELFNADFIFYVEGKPYSNYLNKVVSFNEDHYLDFEKPYRFRIISKGYELNYPQFVKSIMSIIICYGHDDAAAINLSLKIYNESMFEILKKNTQTVTGNVIGETALLRMDSILLSYLQIVPSLREDCIMATIDLSGQSSADFVLGSFTFFYRTKSTPKKTSLDKHNKVIHKGEPIAK